MTLRQWVRPPRQLFVMFVALTLVSAAAFGWASCTLVRQDRALAVQRAQEQRDHTLGLVVAALQQRLAALEQSLSTLSRSDPATRSRDAADFARDFPPTAVLLVVQSTGIDAYPSNRLRYYPDVPPDAEPPAGVFAAADRFEFQYRDSAKAVAVLTPLARSPNPTVRAHALVRLARHFRTSGQMEGAARAYRALATIAGVRLDGVPTDLVAREALCALYAAAGRTEEHIREARAIQADLRAGRWRLLRSGFDLYSARASRTLRASDPARPDSDTDPLAETARHLWERRQTAAPARGREAMWTVDQSMLIVSRSTPGALLAFVASSAFIESQWLEEVTALARASGASIALTDAEGHAVLGSGPSAAQQSSSRLASSTGLPWTLSASSSETDVTGRISRSKVVVAGLSAIGLLMIGGSYLIGRAVLRELRVARLQSDFVAAVSHEFRTPVTALRQMSELLVDGRVASDDVRLQYYQALKRESSRLQRLVEGLLRFGRMEAGAMRCQFAPISAATLLTDIVEEFRRERVVGRRTVQLDLGTSAPIIQADADALGCAIWNLLDNAVKYSPDALDVRVELGAETGRVTIRVRDRGVGMAPADHLRIFEKFVRGRAADTLGVPGCGIGLAVARQIVVAHGGAISVDSVAGQGATFTIVLTAGVSDAVISAGASDAAGRRLVPRQAGE